MPTIAIVGAGPRLGHAIARRFGSEGHDVALVSRDSAKLEGLVERLAAEGVTAGAFPADVLDRPVLARALDAAAERFGGIDVLEYSPSGTAETTRLALNSESTPEDIQGQIEFQLYGAMAATAAVLPAMRERGAGTLLYTTGAGSVDPVPVVGNVNAAAAALRNWAIGLNKELAGSGVYPVHVGIDASIEVESMPGIPVASAEEIAEAYWGLHESRQQAELVFRP